MAAKRLADLVKDWGGFERLVAKLHETGQVSVEHDVELPGRSGAPRQIDVLVRHREGLYEHLIVVECKYRNSPVERLHVDALATTIREVGAARGVIFSVEGFQSGAVEQAKHENISLFRLREPTDEEWGLPGRQVDIWLHVISLGLGGIQFPGATVLAEAPTSNVLLNLELGYPEHISQTPATVAGAPDTTLEKLVERLARGAAKAAYRPARIDFGNSTWSGVVRSLSRVRYDPKEPVRVSAGEGLILLPHIHFELGLRVDQSRIQIDRAERYAFVLAVEDCIRDVVSTAAREHGATFTQLAPIAERESDPSEALKNGSIATVWAGPFSAWEDFSGIEPSGGPDKQVALELSSLA